MKRFLSAAIAVLCFSTFAWAEGSSLHFRDDGQFKIVHFTDLHYIHGKEGSEDALQCINSVLSTEKPDLVIITGDVIFGPPAKEGYRAVLDEVAKYGIPFAITFGNHDDESGLSRKELLELIRSYPLAMSDTVDGIKGVTNFALAVKSHKDDSNAFILYAFDSNSYGQDRDISTYDYIHRDQIEWYVGMSEEYRSRNAGTPVPAMAFFHIPIPEFGYAANNDHRHLLGTRMERSCNPQINSGLFTAFIENKDVRAVFCGHDHDDDYITEYFGIVLGYGRFSGCKSNVYFHLEGGNGARVITITEGSPEWQTWIRLTNGECRDFATLPDDLMF